MLKLKLVSEASQENVEFLITKSDKIAKLEYLGCPKVGRGTNPFVPPLLKVLPPFSFMCAHRWLSACHNLQIHTHATCIWTSSEIREAFETFDVNKSGTIDASELGKVMQWCGQNPTNSELQAVIDEVDVSGKKKETFTFYVVQSVNDFVSFYRNSFCYTINLHVRSFVWVSWFLSQMFNADTTF